MGWGFRRSVKVLPGVRLTIGKSGVSTSVGVRGARVTAGPRGTRATAGLPGTGVSYSQKIGGGARRRPPAPQRSGSVLWTVAGVGCLGLLGLTVLVAVLGSIR